MLLLDQLIAPTKILGNSLKECVLLNLTLFPQIGNNEIGRQLQQSLWTHFLWSG